MKAGCPPELKAMNVAELDDLSLIEVSKLFVRESVTDATCDCKSYCATQRFPCKTANIKCSIRCHSKRGRRKNKG
ncbi:unnamed protein product [Didymodactylos carnosus]|uniref:Uncharacterized protein n=1 Tax=Didymodactylos carnosus TaxID=1234261 RepID=A0A815ZN16_9BILA|nr:unnamed protein product [Didymodactylos carnosus]CAF4454635.1 unnamed protein product [Didymodactylos carnosus]